ncbi:ATP-dependent DNA helicase PcrA [subsurface metagenome]
MITFNQNRKQKKLIPTKPPVADIVINAFEDEAEEAEAVAQQVKELTDQGASLNDIAVFYRVNAMSRMLEEAFIRNKIPYQVVRGVEFYNRKEIRDLLAYLKILVNPSDEIALLRIINTPPRGIGKTTVDRVRAYAALHNITFFDGLKNAEDIDSLSKAAKARIAAFVNMLEQFKKDVAGKVAPLTERVFAESGLQKSLRGAGVESETALENANELINAANIYDQQAQEPSLLDYLQQISLFSDADAYDSSSGRVALMTLHTAKGLEFENVFIVGVEHGLLPHERSNASEDEDELEEERRLFFVGITRAKVGLYISCARYRTVRGQMLRTIPSQFLFELGLDFTEQTAENQHFSDDTGVAQILNSQFKKGQFVRHKTFGPGTVQEFIDMGENSIVVVKFNSGQTKSLMLKYANLSKI